jgi:hypothetical protein
MSLERTGCTQVFVAPESMAILYRYIHKNANTRPGGMQRPRAAKLHLQHFHGRVSFHQWHVLRNLSTPMTEKHRVCFFQISSNRREPAGVFWRDPAIVFLNIILENLLSPRCGPPVRRLLQTQQSQTCGFAEPREEPKIVPVCFRRDPASS